MPAFAAGSTLILLVGMGSLPPFAAIAHEFGAECLLLLSLN
jgi:hypothetical protein